MARFKPTDSRRKGDNMKFYRFMRMSEFSALTAGVELVNNRNYALHAHTDSVGFCFFTADSRAKAFNAYDFLMGIVARDVLVEFEADPAMFTKSVGVYADPYSDWDMCVDEYCTTHYSLDNCTPVAYGVFDVFGCDWYEFR